MNIEIEILKAEWRIADLKDRKYLTEANSKDYTKSLIATIKMNAQISIKKQLELHIGREIMKEVK